MSRNVGYGKGPYKAYSDMELLEAFVEVRDRQPYKRMSAEIYNDHRGDYPEESTLRKRFGPWTDVRMWANLYAETF
jgi:hypothetical protein